MILVLTNPRTASTWFCNRLAVEHNCADLGELFHADDQKGQHQENLSQLYTQPNSVVKLFAVHFESKEVPELLHKLVQLADQIFVLVRKDFNAELKSFYIADYLSGLIDDWHSAFEKPVRIVYREKQYSSLKNHLLDQLNKLSAVHKELDQKCKLVYTEDLVRDNYAPVPRPVMWSKEPPVYNVDIMSMFGEGIETQ